MYTFFAIFITIALIALTIFGARTPSAEGKKKFLFVNLAISVISSVVIIILPFVAYEMVFDGDSPSEWQNWAWDAFAVFLKTTFPICGLCLAAILLTTLVTNAVNSKRNLFSAVVRQSVSVAVSVILLFFAPFYAAMAETDQISIHVIILIIGVCEALFMRLSFVLELFLRIKRTKEDGKRK